MSHWTPPGLHVLELTPSIVTWLTADLDRADAHWKPAPDRWSVVEVVSHLAEIESRGFRGRAEAILAEQRPLLPGLDADALARDGRYAERDLAESLDAFREERRSSLDFLSGVEPYHLLREGLHGELGVVTLGHLLHEWPLHDLGHVRQIAELVRARKFLPLIGPWQKQYALEP